MGCGLWVLSGFLVFVIAEKLFCGSGEEETEAAKADHFENNNCADKVVKNGMVKPVNGLTKNGECNGFKKSLNGVNYKNCNGYTNGFPKANGVKPLNGFDKINGVKPLENGANNVYGKNFKTNVERRLNYGQF